MAVYTELRLCGVQTPTPCRLYAVSPEQQRQISEAVLLHTENAGFDRVVPETRLCLSVLPL